MLKPWQIYKPSVCKGIVSYRYRYFCIGRSTNLRFVKASSALDTENAAIGAEGRLPYCYLNRTKNQLLPGPPLLGPSGSVQPNLTNPINDLNPLSIGIDQSQLEAQNRDISLKEVTPITSREDVGNMLKNELEKPAGLLIHKGEIKKGTYGSCKKPSGGFEVTVDPTNYHITVSMSTIEYSDFGKDFGFFKRRLSFINHQLKAMGNTHIFKLQ